MSMTVIEHIEVGSGGAASISLTSIPDTYTDLYLALSLRAETADTTAIQLSLNGSTASFTRRHLWGSGSGATTTSASDSNLSFGLLNPGVWTANTFANASIYIPNYTSSANKSFSVDAVSENNATAAYQTIAAGLWSNTAAITSIGMTVSGGGGGDFAQYSSATLYGITAGSDGSTTVS